MKKKEKEDNHGVDPKSVAWMELLQRAGGRINSDKDMEKLKKFSERTDWRNLSQSPEFKRGGNND